MSCIGMKPGWKAPLALALLASASMTPAVGAAATGPGDAGWEKLSDEDGIRTWRKEVEGSSVIAFRGETVINASIARIVQVLDDTSRKTEWVAKAAEARDVRVISELERIEYNHTSTPIVLRDRDFVFHVKTEFDKERGQVRVHMRSVDDPAEPDTGKYIRGRLLDSRYVLTVVDPGRTRVLVEIHADPMGSVAKWIVNLFQRAWPRNTLEGIRAQSAKADVPEHRRVRDFFFGAGPGS